MFAYSSNKTLWDEAGRKALVNKTCKSLEVCLLAVRSFSGCFMYNAMFVAMEENCGYWQITSHAKSDLYYVL